MSRRRSKGPADKRPKPKRPNRRSSPSGTRSPWRRYRWLLILALLGAAAGLYAYDYRGPLETVTGEVISTRTYPHSTPTEGPHTHTEAVLEFEGRRHTVPQADGVSEGQKVTVVVARGRITGRARFLDLRVSRTQGQ